MITFEKFFNLIKERNISQNELIRRGIIDPRLLNALKHNKSITTNSLNKICILLDCEPYDILTFTKDESEEQIYES